MRFIIHRFESVASTNDLAIRMAEEGAPEGTVVIAGDQTAGRGRHGRSWVSPPGMGLYLSLILRPDKPFSELWQVAFVASLAAAEAVSRVSGLQARIKWPNDIMLNARKVSGLLVEARAAGEDCLVPVVVGIGINVNAADFPPEVMQNATSISREVGGPVSLQDVERELLRALDARYTQYLGEGFSSILSAWKSLDCTVGRHVVVRSGDRDVEGTAVEVNPEGDLVLEREDGARTSVTAGEVILEG